MKLKTLLAAALAPPCCRAATAAPSVWRFQGDLSRSIPYSLTRTFTHGMLANVYEGLTSAERT